MLVEKDLMNPETNLKNEITLLERECGLKAKLMAYRNLVAVVRWVRESGHGSITLNAVDHFLGDKIRTETVITAGGK